MAFFSETITVVLFMLLEPFYAVTFDFTTKGPLFRVEDFIVRIGQPCSGIDSMLLFVAFFASLLALDHKKIYKGRFLVFSLIGLIGVYVVNIVRLFLLTLIGVHVSPQIAVGLFHTNAGWVFFVLYFLLYYWFIKRFIYKTTVITQKK